MNLTETFALAATSFRLGRKIQLTRATATGERIWAKVLILAALLCSPSLQLEAQNATASFATANDQHWIFETSNGHIWQIVYTYSNGSLASSDLTYNELTRETYAPAAAPASGLSGFATSNDQHWVFETSDGHIWQIVYTYSNGSFGSGDLTLAANGAHVVSGTLGAPPPAAPGSGLSSFATNNDQHWVFQTSNGHIWQIVYTYSNGSFGSGDLTQGTGAPTSAIGMGLSSFATDKDQHWIFETTDGNIWQIVYTYSNFCNPFSGLCGSFG
jgi:hypothetical protein